MENARGKKLFVDMWRDIFKSHMRGNIAIDVVAYCSAGRHRSVAIVDLALNCCQELNLPCVIYAEHLCKCNWAFQTCDGCEFCRAVDADKIEARRIAATLCEEAMRTANFDLVW